MGLGYTRFPGHTVDDLRRAILAGQTQAAGVLWGAARVAQIGALQARRGLGALLMPAAR